MKNLKEVFRTSAGDGEDYPERSPETQDGTIEAEKVPDTKTEKKQAQNGRQDNVTNGP